MRTGIEDVTIDHIMASVMGGVKLFSNFGVETALKIIR
jgi:hypothetical protein